MRRLRGLAAFGADGGGVNAVAVVGAVGADVVALGAAVADEGDEKEGSEKGAAKGGGVDGEAARVDGGGDAPRVIGRWMRGIDRLPSGAADDGTGCNGQPMRHAEVGEGAAEMR